MIPAKSPWNGSFAATSGPAGPSTSPAASAFGWSTTERERSRWLERTRLLWPKLGYGIVQAT
jgi:hypothetical protein